MLDARVRTVALVLLSWAVASPGWAQPAAPSNVVAFPSATGEISLTWTDDSGDEDDFTVERMEDGQPTWESIATLGPDTIAYVDEGAPSFPLSAKTLYHYRVSASNQAGSSAPSAAASAWSVFVGMPFPGWLVVTDPPYNAQGDGSTDDTAAIQAALNDLRGSFGNAGPTTLYFPAGAYIISDTLFLTAQQTLQLIGERDPVTGLPLVEMRWMGGCQRSTPLTWSSGALDFTLPMFHAEGVPRTTYAHFDWNANCTSLCGGPDQCQVVAFDQSHCGILAGIGFNQACADIPVPPGVVLGEAFSNTASTHVDNVYRDAYVGLRIAHYDQQDSEITARRNRFNGNVAGVSSETPNALQDWFWDNEFSGNQVGITQQISRIVNDACTSPSQPELGGGNFHLLRNRFLGSTSHDIYTGAQPFTYVENFSKGSERFLTDSCVSNGPSILTLVRNQIDGLTGDHAIVNHNAGPLVMLDNRIDSEGGGSEPVLVSGSGNTDLLSIGNEYSEDPFFNLGGANRVRSIDDVTGAASFDLIVPPLPIPADPRETRPVYTVTDGSNLHETVNAAIADDLPALVYIPDGRHQIDAPLVIPAGSDLVLHGNGRGTEIEYVGPSGGAVIEIDGHDARGLTLRDLMVDADFLGDAVRVSGVDQTDARVLVSKTIVRHPDVTPGNAGIVIDGADRPVIDLIDSGSSGQPPLTTGLLVKNGDEPMAGVNIWTGGGGNHDWEFDIENGTGGAKVLIVGVRTEGNQRHLRLRGNASAGQVSVWGANEHDLGEDDPPPLGTSYLVEDYDGEFSLVCSGFSDRSDDGSRLVETGSPGATIALLGNFVFSPETNIAGEHTDHFAPNATVTRTNTKIWCDGNNLVGDCENPDPALPPGSTGHRSAPDLPAPWSNDQAVRNGVALMRSQTIPAFFDEPGALANHQLNLHNVRLEQGTSGLVLRESISEVVLSSVAGEDGFLREQSEFAEVGKKAVSNGRGGIRLGDNKRRKQIRALVSFDTSGIPTNALVLSAYLDLQLVTTKGDPLATLPPAHVDVEGGGFSGDVALAPGDFEAAATAPGAALLEHDAVTGSARAYLSPAGLGAIDRAGTTQLRIAFDLDDDDDGEADRLHYGSGENAGTGDEPRLTVRWIQP